MKKSYPKMSVRLVGSVGNEINKSGTYVDCSQNFESKTFDSGDGQETNCG